MKFTETQHDVLKIFQYINPSILFKPGKKVATISNNKNIMGVCHFRDLTIPVEAPIYDLGVFQTTALMLGDTADKFSCEVDFQDNFVHLRRGQSRMKYHYAAKTMITTPPDKIVDLGEPVQRLRIQYSDLSKMFSASGLYTLPDICFTAHGGKLEAVVTDKRNSSSNVFAIDLGETDKEFCFCVKAENFKAAQPSFSRCIESYDIELYSQKVAKLFANFNESSSREVESLELMIALEPDSDA